MTPSAPLAQMKMGGFGAVNPQVAAYSSEENEPTEAAEPEQEVQNDEVTKLASANQNQNIVNKESATQNRNDAAQKFATPAATESTPSVSKPTAKAHKDLEKVHAQNVPQAAEIAHAQAPKKQVSPSPLLAQNAPLTTSPTTVKLHPNLAAASRFFDSFRTNQGLKPYYQPPVTARVSPVFSPAFMKASYAKNLHALQPAVSHTTSPQLFKPAVSPAKTPQTINPAAPFNDDASAAKNMQNNEQNNVHPQTFSFAKPQDVTAAYSFEQPLRAPYPTGAYYSWNSQNYPSDVPVYPWNSNAYYPQYPSYTPPAPYRPPGRNNTSSPGIRGGELLCTL